MTGEKSRWRKRAEEGTEGGRKRGRIEERKQEGRETENIKCSIDWFTSQWRQQELYPGPLCKGQGPKYLVSVVTCCLPGALTHRQTPDMQRELARLLWFSPSSHGGSHISSLEDSSNLVATPSSPFYWAPPTVLGATRSHQKPLVPSRKLCHRVSHWPVE